MIEFLTSFVKRRTNEKLEKCASNHFVMPGAYQYPFPDRLCSTDSYGYTYLDH